MRATPMNVKFITNRRNENSTAFYIFNKQCLHPFLVSNVYHRMRHGLTDVPIVSSSRKETDEFLNSTTLVLGTIIEMSDYFQQGATVGFDDPKVAATVYKHILKHMEAHLNAMRTDRLYEPPKDTALQELGEFATAIRNVALVSDQDLDRSRLTVSYLDRISASRSFISFTKNTQPKQDVVDDIIKPMKVKDAIEEWLELMGYAEG